MMRRQTVKRRDRERWREGGMEREREGGKNKCKPPED